MNEIYKKELSKFSLLSNKEELELAKQAKAGSLRARNTLVERNLTYAFSVAKKYQNNKVPLEELVAAANEGLIKAVERYDYTKGMRLITYSFHWIKAYIMETLKNSDVVRTPEERENAIMSSIDEPVGEDLYMYETLEYDGELADTNLHKEDFKKHLHSIISGYPQKTKDVLDGYYQIYDEFATIDRVANKYKMSLEGIRKIKNKTISELKLKLEY